MTFRDYVIRGSVCDDFLQTGPSLLLLLFERRRRRATSNYCSDFGAWYFARLYSSDKSAIF